MKAIVALLLLAPAACIPILPEESLIIDEIEVTGVSDGFGTSDLDIEVHLYEVGEDGRELYLGCAGKETGLENVDVNDARFTTRAYFLPRTGGDVALELGDIREERVLVVVTEDDEDECPVEQDATRQSSVLLDNQDDLVGKSSAIDRPDIEAGVALSFEKVVQLSLSLLGPDAR